MNNPPWHQIQCLILDVDGICTDGRLVYSSTGEMVKIFHAHDGQGIRTLIEHNIRVCIISGRSHPSVENRFKTLGVERIYQAFLSLVHIMAIVVTWCIIVDLNVRVVSCLGIMTMVVKFIVIADCRKTPEIEQIV